MDDFSGINDRLVQEEDHVEFYPDKDALEKLVVRTFYEKADVAEQPRGY